MTKNIYIIKDNQLTRMQQQEYLSEDQLQPLLEEHPELIPGDVIDTDNPRKWLLVNSEMGVPDNNDSGSRWSIDHLLMDQDAIPTLVEVKRASDRRIRREVVDVKRKGLPVPGENNGTSR